MHGPPGAVRLSKLFKIFGPSTGSFFFGLLCRYTTAAWMHIYQLLISLCRTRCNCLAYAVCTELNPFAYVGGRDSSSFFLFDPRGSGTTVRLH